MSRNFNCVWESNFLECTVNCINKIMSRKVQPNPIIHIKPFRLNTKSSILKLGNLEALLFKKAIRIHRH